MLFFIYSCFCYDYYSVVISVIISSIFIGIVIIGSIPLFVVLFVIIISMIIVDPRPHCWWLARALESNRV